MNTPCNAAAKMREAAATCCAQAAAGETDAGSRLTANALAISINSMDLPPCAAAALVDKIKWVLNQRDKDCRERGVKEDVANHNCVVRLRDVLKNAPTSPEKD